MCHPERFKKLQEASCCVRAGAFLERVEERLPAGHQPFFSNGMFGLDSTTASSSFVANLGVELND